MLKFTCKCDFSALYRAVDQAKAMTREAMEEVGEEAVEYARENGDYQDRTGRLRSSTTARVEGDDLVIENDAPYAAYVEAKGYDVISGAALYARQRLREESGR
ncbi:MAG: HK97 gp10 family phage protein [Bacteroidales bacterium]|nr:HK97 gp10 family phage protein [Bacteroidales bacterium]